MKRYPYRVWIGSWSYDTRAEHLNKAKRNAAHAYKATHNTEASIETLMKRAKGKRG